MLEEDYLLPNLLLKIYLSIYTPFEMHNLKAYNSQSCLVVKFTLKTQNIYLYI